MSSSPGARLGPRGAGLGALLITGLDEALLSASNFAIALLFIGSAPKEEYGRYTLVSGVVMLMVGVETALVISPLTVNGSRVTGPERRRFVAALFRIQLGLGLACATVLAAAIALRRHTGDGLLAASAAVAVAGAFLREFQRGVEFLEGRPARALLIDAAFVALAGATLAAAWWTSGGLSAWAVLLAVGAGAFAPGLLAFLVGGGTAVTLRECRRAGATVIGQGRWTLPGMAVTWGQTTGYAYIAAALLGSAAVAELTAARLFIVPLNTLMSAWGKIFVPRAGARLAAGDRAGVLGECRRNAALLLAITLLHSAAVVGFIAAGGERWLPARYAGLGQLLPFWCAFGVISLERYVATQALYAHGAFRSLFRCAIAGAVSTVALVAALIPLFGTRGALAGLIGGELLLGVMAWRILFRDAGPSDALEPPRATRGLA